MGLFSVFSDDDGTRAATQAGRARNRGIDEASSIIKKYGKKSINATNTGYDTATGNINTGYDTGVGNINSGYDQGADFLTQGHNYLDNGVQEAVNPLGLAGDEYKTLLDKGNAGIDRYGVLTGSQGGQAGLDAFHNSIDYLNSRAGADAGTEALLRAGAGQGQVGRMQGDLAKYLMQYDQGILNDARSALNPYFDLATNAAQGYGGVQGDISSLYSDLGKNHATLSGKEADLATGRGTALSNLATGRASALSNLATGRGGDLSNIYTNMGANNAGLAQGKGNSNAQMIQDKYAAGQTASMNQWNALMGVAQAGLGFV